MLHAIFDAKLHAKLDAIISAQLHAIFYSNINSVISAQMHAIFHYKLNTNIPLYSWLLFCSNFANKVNKAECGDGDGVWKQASSNMMFLSLMHPDPPICYGRWIHKTWKHGFQSLVTKIFVMRQKYG